jgi:hypothetical protein
MKLLALVLLSCLSIHEARADTTIKFNVQVATANNSYATYRSRGKQVTMSMEQFDNCAVRSDDSDSDEPRPIDFGTYTTKDEEQDLREALGKALKETYQTYTAPILRKDGCPKVKIVNVHRSVVVFEERDEGFLQGSEMLAVYTIYSADQIEKVIQAIKKLPENN